MERWLKGFVDAFSKPGTGTRPYRNAAVSFRECPAGDFAARARLVEKVGLNVFKFPAREIPGCDLLTDSGTTTMTMRQWSQILLGDEAYGSNEGYFELKDQIADTFGPQWTSHDPDRETVFIFHQGRAAEHGLFRVLARLVKPGRGAEPMLIPSNGHFDTTEANLEDNGFAGLNLFSPGLRRKSLTDRFKGNMDLAELNALLRDPGRRARIPLVYLTITNNTGGGQPVSLANIKAVREATARHGIPLFFDACRFAENAWFIQQHEAGMKRSTIRDIVHRMFEQVDGFHISLKKDGLANMGGALVLKPGSMFTARYPRFQELLTDHQILVEGHPTYGGLAGRDLKAIVEGLKTVGKQSYLDHRISQVERFGAEIRRQCGNQRIVSWPVGGHAVYLDVDEFFKGTRLSDADLPGISLTGLLLIGGHRLCELGIYAFGRNENGKEIGPDPRVNNVRAAVPRLMYEDQDLSALARAIGVLYERRRAIPGVDVVYGRGLRLRHFKSRFRFRR